MDKYFKAQPEFVWERNPEWIGIPPDPGTNNKMYVLFAVIEDNPNELGFRTTDGSSIDWGDGSTTSIPAGASFSDEYHTYTYSAVTGPILTLEDGRNYKNVLVDVTVDNSGYGYYLFYIWYNDNTSTRCVNNVLEIVSYLGDGSALAGSNRVQIFTSQYTHCVLCEHISLKGPNINSVGGMFWYCKNLKKIDLPSNFWHSGLVQANYLCRGASLNNHDFGDITIGDTGSYQITPFAYADSFKIGNYTLVGNTITTSHFQHSNNYSVGNFTALSVTSAVYTFGGTVNNGADSIGIIDMPALQDARFMFRRSQMPEVVFTDCSSINDTTSMFLDCESIQKVIMPGLTVSVDVSGNLLTATAIDAFFTSIGTASGAQTLDVSGNSGSATCDTTIATAKGFTVIT